MTSDEALKSIYAILSDGSVANLTKFVAGLTRRVYKILFGDNLFSLKFLLRSFVATTVSWAILIVAKHGDWSYIYHNIIYTRWYIALIPMWYLLDIFCIGKSGVIIHACEVSKYKYSMLLFFLSDVVISFVAIFFLKVYVYSVARGFGLLNGTSSDGFEDYYISRMESPIDMLDAFLNLSDFSDYVTNPSYSITLSLVVAPSTMLVSTWTLLLLTSSVIARTLVPLEYVRRFTNWWFRDVEKHPISAIAVVMAAFVVIGASSIKLVRYVWG